MVINAHKKKLDNYFLVNLKCFECDNGAVLSSVISLLTLQGQGNQSPEKFELCDETLP